MIKKNFFTGDYVIYSTERANKPQEIKRICKEVQKECPFCLDNKDLLKNVIYENFDKEILIIPNKYPILRENNDFFGLHQVIIDTKEHKKRLHYFSEEHMFFLMKSFQDSFKNFLKNEKLRYVQFFKNQGFTSGASQPHSHWQILAVPILPLKQEKIVQAFKHFEKENDKCYLCELDIQKYKIEENKYFYAFCPEDSLFYYEINIMPKSHITSMIYLTDAELKYLGIILRNCIKRLNGIFPDLDYNICLFNALRNEDEYHFFFQIIPRLGNVGGYEFSTGMFVNSILPEIATQNLKKILI